MPERLVIIDAFAHIYQFFYAIKGLTGPDGEPVNAVYGFARMIEDLRRKYDPDYLAVAFDGPGEVERKKIYDEYKAGRAPMPEALQRQLPLIHELLEASGIPELTAEGHEADDVLGAVASRAAEEGIQTVIVTTDKDAEQLISDHTSVLHLHKDRQVMLDPAELKQQKGITPEQVVEVMALAGDSTDNIPGVPGVGPKTALKLIQQFGSIESLYASLDEVSGEKLRENLREHRADVDLSARLVKIKADIPLELDLDECRVGSDSRQTLNRFYRALGFRSLISEGAPPGATTQGALFAEPAAPPDEELTDLESVEKDYAVVRDMDGVRELAGKLRARETVSVDLETTSVEPREARIVGIAFSWRPDQGVYVAAAGPKGEDVCPLEEALAALKPILEAEEPGKIGQNLKYDMGVLKNYGVELGGLRCDSMVASYLLQPAGRSHGLDALAARHLGYRTVKIEELIGKGKDQISMDRVPVGKVGPYACEDTDLALQLCELLSERLSAEDLWDLFAELELPLVPVLAEMEWQGIRVDTDHLAAVSGEFADRLAELEAEIFEAAGEQFNVNSPQQLSTILYEKLELPVPRGGRRKTGWSTASDALMGLREEHPIAGLLLQYRELSKLKSTYADALIEMINAETGRIHASFNQTVTATGRLSSSDPNLQNIPVRTPLGRRIRRAFVPGDDDMSLLSADYSQVELRIVAHCSGDPALRGAFEQDRDIHRFVAAQVHGVAEDDVTDEMRQQAKAVNFGIIYGLSRYGLSRQIGVSPEEADRFIQSYFERYPKVRQFIGSTIKQARRDGFVKTLAGRRRAIEGIRASGAARSAAERIAVNTVIQGTAADLIKRAMIRIHQGLRDVSERSHMLLQIHDELVFEAPDAEMDEVRRFVIDEMSGALELEVPLKVDTAVGKNWAEAK